MTSLPSDLDLIEPNTPYVNAALGARFTNGVGYVTLAFNNSTNAQQVPPALPVSLSLSRWCPSSTAATSRSSSRTTPSTNNCRCGTAPTWPGRSRTAEFQWRWVEPVGGLIPNTDFGTWAVYGSDPAVGTNEVTLSGASPFTLSDHYFAVRYRPTNHIGPHRHELERLDLQPRSRLGQARHDRHQPLRAELPRHGR